MAFSCNNPACVVGITVKTVSFVFVSTGGARLPLGRHILFYAVRANGGDEFTIKATGATMDPITDKIPKNKKTTGGSQFIDVAE